MKTSVQEICARAKVINQLQSTVAR